MEPTCPQGYSEVSVQFGNASLADLPAVPRCIPTTFCADGRASNFEPIRELLFGSNYKNDPEKAKVAAAIEAVVCVNVQTVDRPDTPYQTNEGCIDCHLLGMNTMLDDLLEYNVAPLENTFQAWGISNRWGPNLSFNLTTEVKGKPTLPLSYAPDVSQPDPDGVAIQNLLQDASHQIDPLAVRPPPSAPLSSSGSDTLNRAVDWQRSIETDFQSSLKYYRLTQGAKQEAIVGQSVTDMLYQLKGSFQRIQDVLTALPGELTFDQTAQCTF
ncbi:hypothetical protein IPJ72_07070 [Candidatus Peregrinibacteria bacterium]|nr:MAG: hypothetical protein IPJ72_07070 [Candidatus Peregrinibacteria bacterium]